MLVIKTHEYIVAFHGKNKRTKSLNVFRRTSYYIRIAHVRSDRASGYVDHTKTKPSSQNSVAGSR